MPAQWTPPTDGTPCWINVLASDVPRAKKFYEEVFNWKFPHKVDGHDKPYDETQIAMFETPGQPCPGGGITRIKEEEFTPSKAKGGVMLYLYVEDLEGWEEKITKAGGKKASEVEPEGDSALMQHFEDSEGNWVGLYTMKKK